MSLDVCGQVICANRQLVLDECEGLVQLVVEVGTARFLKQDCCEGNSGNHKIDLWLQFTDIGSILIYFLHVHADDASRLSNVAEVILLCASLWPRAANTVDTAQSLHLAPSVFWH